MTLAKAEQKKDWERQRERLRKTRGTSQFSYLILPRSSLELEVVLVRHLRRRPKALISAPMSKGGILKDQYVRIHKSSLHGGLLTTETPPYWTTVIYWMWQLIGLRTDKLKFAYILLVTDLFILLVYCQKSVWV